MTAPAVEVETYVLSERVLSDDTLSLAPDGHVFRGGYVAVLTYHTYANPWEDRQHVRRFRTMDAAERFIERLYGKGLDALFDELES